MALVLEGEVDKPGRWQSCLPAGFAPPTVLARPEPACQAGPPTWLRAEIRAPPPLSRAARFRPGHPSLLLHTIHSLQIQPPAMPEPTRLNGTANGVHPLKAANTEASTPLSTFGASASVPYATAPTAADPYSYQVSTQYPRCTLHLLGFADLLPSLPALSLGSGTGSRPRRSPTRFPRTATRRSASSTTFTRSSSTAPLLPPSAARSSTCGCTASGPRSRTAPCAPCPGTPTQRRHFRP